MDRGGAARISVCLLALAVAGTARAAPDGGAEQGRERPGAADAGTPRSDGGSPSAGAPAGPPSIDPAEARAVSGCVLRAHLEGIVSRGTADYLESAVREAEGSSCQALLVVIDTPGGMLEATRQIVRTFLAADVTIVTYVAPGGARAGSAGVFVTMAGHVAAMAPGSNIGAAHPVVGMGGKDPEEAGGKHMAEKVENDTAAFARSIAEQRGRNVQWAEKAVRESVSVTATEAERKRVVDLIAASEAELLDVIDGRLVALSSGPVQLATAQARVQDHDMTIRQRAMSILGNPNLAYILFMIGVLGIMLEIYNPGMIVPGAVGAFALLLAAIGLDALPVNIGAIVLLVVAVALFVAEIFVTSFGLLTLGGLVSLLVGASLLIDDSDPEFFADASVSLSWGAVLPSALLVTGAVAGFGWQAAKLRKRRSPTGREGLVGETGRTATAVDAGGGRVRIHGETWSATSETPLPPDTAVEVVAVRGLELQVRPTDATDVPPARSQEET